MNDPRIRPGGSRGTPEDPRSGGGLREFAGLSVERMMCYRSARLSAGDAPVFPWSAVPITRCGGVRILSLPASDAEATRDGGQLDRVRAIGHQQDHLDPHDLHRGQRALAHRDRPPGRAAGLDHAPADRRARVVAPAGAHGVRPLPGRAAAAHDRRRRCHAAQRRRARALGAGGPRGRDPQPGPARRAGRDWRSPTSRSSPGHRPVSSFCPAATLPAHPTALGRALLAFSSVRRRRRGDRRWAAGVHPAHDHLAGPVPPGAHGHPPDPRRGDPLGVRARRVRRGDAGVRAGRRRRRRDRAGRRRPRPRAAVDDRRPGRRVPQPLARAGDRAAAHPRRGSADARRVQPDPRRARQVRT